MPTDPLVFECLNSFDEFWRTEQHLHATKELARELARRAFVSGFLEGGKQGSKIMCEHAVAILKQS